jgi:hypothetical protein
MNALAFAGEERCTHADEEEETLEEEVVSV